MKTDDVNPPWGVPFLRDIVVVDRVRVLRRQQLAADEEVCILSFPEWSGTNSPNS